MRPFRSILSAVFVVLVLFSSSSFMVGIHLCGGQVQNMALFSKAEGCEMEKWFPPCHRHESAPCCEDETVVHDSQDFKGEITQMGIAALPAVGILQPAVLLAEVIPSAIISRTQYYNYDPPLRSSDLTVSHQIFLI